MADPKPTDEALLPPPPEPPKEEPMPAVVEADEEEAVFVPTDGPVTNRTLSVADAERAVEDAEMRFFQGTRQGTAAHVAAKQRLAEAQANLRLARRMRRYGRKDEGAVEEPTKS